MAKPIVTHIDARESAQRFIDGHFGNGEEGPRISIPARPDHDDDLRITDYIDQQEALGAKLAEIQAWTCESCKFTLASPIKCSACLWVPSQKLAELFGEEP
jgi:hypothetical protein